MFTGLHGISRRNIVRKSYVGVHPGADLCECAGVDVGGGKMQDKIGPVMIVICFVLLFAFLIYRRIVG